MLYGMPGEQQNIKRRWWWRSEMIWLKGADAEFETKYPQKSLDRRVLVRFFRSEVAACFSLTAIWVSTLTDRCACLDWPRDPVAQKQFVAVAGGVEDRERGVQVAEWRSGVER